MMHVVDRKFEMIKDVDASWCIENVHASQCTFNNCLFSRSKHMKRSLIKNTIADRCKFIGCQIGPGKFVNCHIINSTATDLIIFWGSIFENVVFSDRVPALKINTKITLVPDEDLQNLFDQDRIKHYSNIKIAIDISNARFTSFDCRGIPANLFKIDSDTQAVIRKKNLKNEIGARNIDSNPWYPWIASFLSSNEDDIILASPLAKPKHKRDSFIKGLAELRSMGIADPA